MEEEAERLFAEIERVGGVVKGIETGWFQRQIAQSALRHQHEIEQKRRVIVGVNEFVTDEDHAVDILKVGDDADQVQRRRMAAMRARRDAGRAERALEVLRETAASEANVMPAILDAARADCTLYEIRHALEEVYGAYREPVFF
jgi:methylmalonyl-CoA mutase N-terminal domain/subunit